MWRIERIRHGNGRLLRAKNKNPENLNSVETAFLFNVANALRDSGAADQFERERRGWHPRSRRSLRNTGVPLACAYICTSCACLCMYRVWYVILTISASSATLVRRTFFPRHPARLGRGSVCSQPAYSIQREGKRERRKERKREKRRRRRRRRRPRRKIEPTKDLRRRRKMRGRKLICLLETSGEQRRRRRRRASREALPKAKATHLVLSPAGRAISSIDPFSHPRRNMRGGHRTTHHPRWRRQRRRRSEESTSVAVCLVDDIHERRGDDLDLPPYSRDPSLGLEDSERLFPRAKREGGFFCFKLSSWEDQLNSRKWNETSLT